MIAAQLEAALASRYSGRGWANFFQYRPMTSFGATLSSIDLLSVGLWRTHGDKIIAHEIKVARSDFLKDLKQFKKKHGIAIEISHEYSEDEEKGFAKVLKYIELGMEIENSYGFTHTLKQTHEEINKLQSLIDEKKWAKK